MTLAILGGAWIVVSLVLGTLIGRAMHFGLGD